MESLSTTRRRHAFGDTRPCSLHLALAPLANVASFPRARRLSHDAEVPARGSNVGLIENQNAPAWREHRAAIIARFIDRRSDIDQLALAPMCLASRDIDVFSAIASWAERLLGRPVQLTLRRSENHPDANFIVFCVL